MNIKRDDIRTFLYEGPDNMIDFKTKEIPPAHFEFVAKLHLRNGKIIVAPSDWREKIWNCWYAARKAEIDENIYVRNARGMTANHSSYRSRR